MLEDTRLIPDSFGYYIDKKGNVYGTKRRFVLNGKIYIKERIKKIIPCIDSSGYYSLSITYYKNGKYKTKTQTIHRLVATTFLVKGNYNVVNHR